MRWLSPAGILEPLARFFRPIATGHIAYNATLQAGRALMFARGYRPDGANQHISVVKFAGLFLDEDDLLIFDRMRRKRHSSVYDTVCIISVAEAGFAVSAAEVLVQKIATLLG